MLGSYRWIILWCCVVRIT